MSNIHLVEQHFHTFLKDFDSEHDAAELNYKYSIGEYQGYSMTITDNELVQKLEDHIDVEYVEQNQECHLTQVGVQTQRDAPWNLVRLNQRSPSDWKSFRFPNTAGRGTEIYILDTGVRISHEEFGKRAVWGASFTGEGVDTDNNGHGTNVAGIAAGKKFGVAKSANIVAVKVLRGDGGGSYSGLLAGMDWTYQRIAARRRPAVINVSIAGGRSDAINSAFKSLVDRGVHVVAAAGNSNVDACGISPASELSVLTVGSINQQDVMSGFSNYGSCVSILAPGENIQAAYFSSDNAYAMYSGTSQASPHLAGMKALLLSTGRQYSPYTLDYYIKSIATQNSVQQIKPQTPNSVAYIDLALTGLDTISSYISLLREITADRRSSSEKEEEK